nr:cuticle protein CP575-like [Procambarus clarkii]
MKLLVVVVLGLVVLAAARPSDIIDIEEDHLEHEQEGVPGTAVEGEYSWVAPDGNEYKVKYIADHLGYRVLEDNVVPEVPELEDY